MFKAKVRVMKRNKRDRTGKKIQYLGAYFALYSVNLDLISGTTPQSSDSHLK